MNLKKKKITNSKIAKLACEIEINRIKSPIGKQDQYATSLGGFNVLTFNKNSDVTVRKIRKNNIIKKIFDNSVFIWIGRLAKLCARVTHDWCHIIIFSS